MRLRHAVARSTRIACRLRAPHSGRSPTSMAHSPWSHRDRVTDGSLDVSLTKATESAPWRTSVCAGGWVPGVWGNVLSAIVGFCRAAGITHRRSTFVIFPVRLVLACVSSDARVTPERPASGARAALQGCERRRNATKVQAPAGSGRGSSRGRRHLRR